MIRILKVCRDCADSAYTPCILNGRAIFIRAQVSLSESLFSTIHKIGKDGLIFILDSVEWNNFYLDRKWQRTDSAFDSGGYLILKSQLESFERK
jgi:hypothetical protein